MQSSLSSAPNFSAALDEFKIGGESLASLLAPNRSMAVSLLADAKAVTLEPDWRYIPPMIVLDQHLVRFLTVETFIKGGGESYLRTATRPLSYGFDCHASFVEVWKAVRENCREVLEELPPGSLTAARNADPFRGRIGSLAAIDMVETLVLDDFVKARGHAADEVRLWHQVNRLVTYLLQRWRRDGYYTPPDPWLLQQANKAPLMYCKTCQGVGHRTEFCALKAKLNKVKEPRAAAVSDDDDDDDESAPGYDKKKKRRKKKGNKQKPPAAQPPQSAAQRQEVRKCHSCGKVGHLQAQCRAGPGKNNGGAPQPAPKA